MMLSILSFFDNCILAIGSVYVKCEHSIEGCRNEEWVWFAGIRFFPVGFHQVIRLSPYPRVHKTILLLYR